MINDDILKFTFKNFKFKMLKFLNFIFLIYSKF